uniref:DUF7802 domain-containing protein n=1 Tax=Branchiostoma floridae TaxID=7739 RepID=C3YH88_BRAFL|eukprot:XP_002604313.1 hypothetical protein BRAFLDRAFT_125264 [Branchiostoma floridae]
MAVRVCCVRGSHYQVGLQIGRAARRQIAEYLDRHHVFANLLGILQTEAGRILYEGYLRAAKSAYPHYVEEIVGMSEGSGLPFQHLFLMHCQSEMVLMFTDDCKPVTEIEGCTTVFLNVQNGPRVMVHNEDGDSLVKDLGYVVVANIDPYELPNGDIIPAESFTAFCYPGLLAGNAYSFNLHGLCSSGNFQMAKCVEREKIRSHPWKDELTLVVLLHFLTFAGLAVFAKPETIVSTGVHEPVGPCNETLPMYNAIGQLVSKRKYLCPTDYDEGYMDFHCVPGGRAPPGVHHWYTVCGTPHENHAEHITVVWGFCLLGLTYYYNLLACSGLDESTNKKHKTN